MKNIHILPTDKPSRLHLGNSGLVLCDLNFSKNTINGQNIYITSDEEVKEGDWYCSPSGIISKHNGTEMLPDYWRKIILTTDRDLIADGIEEISEDELLKIIKDLNNV